MQDLFFIEFVYSMGTIRKTDAEISLFLVEVNDFLAKEGYFSETKNFVSGNVKKKILQILYILYKLV